MSAVELKPSDTVTFARDCEATQIPSGTPITISKDTEAYVGQTLGGNVTVQVPAVGLAPASTRTHPHVATVRARRVTRAPARARTRVRLEAVASLPRRVTGGSEGMTDREVPA